MAAREQEAEASSSGQGRSDRLATSALDLEWGAADQVPCNRHP